MKNIFYPRNFTNATSIKYIYFNGKSFHPLNIFKGVISREEKRMKRINERKVDYYESLKALKLSVIHPISTQN